MRLRLRRFGLLGRTYALMVASLLLAEALLFLLLVVTAPPLPPLVPFDLVVRALDGHEIDDSRRLIVSERSRSPEPQSDALQALMLARAVAQSLDLPTADVRARVAVANPPPTFGPQPEVAIANGERPLLLLGDFSIERRIGPDRWRRIETDGSFQGAVRWRFLILLAGTFVVVLPFAYMLARFAIRPIDRFADAADRLGRDPEVPPLPMSGPPELRTAVEALNRMQERISRYVRDRTTMVSAMAHDLRTPLMRLSFQIEEVEGPLRGRLGRQVEEMREKISVVLNHMRDERSRNAQIRLDLSSTVEAVCENARDAGDEVTSCPAPKTIVMGDPNGLRSVFENLIGNAVRYGGSAEVHVVTVRDKAVITISDAGPGIPQESLDKVFEPFFQLDAARSAGGGVGLGLTLVRSVIAAHEGEVVLRNRYGGGLEVTVSLPLALHAR